jgi:hypothetical protein
MYVVCHEAKPVDATAELLLDVLQDKLKAIPVAVFKKYRKPGIAAKYYMIDCAREMYARFTCHGWIIHRNSRKLSLTLKVS